MTGVKTIVLLAVLLMSVAGMAEDKMTIITITADPFSGAVKFPDSAKGDQAVVRVTYWATSKIEGKPQHLVLSKTCIIPVVPGVAVVFDDVPTSRDRVRNIDVQLVGNLDKQTILASELQK